MVFRFNRFKTEKIFSLNTTTFPLPSLTQGIRKFEFVAKTQFHCHSGYWDLAMRLTLFEVLPKFESQEAFQIN